MIARIWVTRCHEGRADQYERFAQEVSLPMFGQQDGIRGVLFLRQGEDCRVLTLWDDMTAVERLADSESYRATVEKIIAAGFLFGEQAVDILDVHGGFLDPKLVDVLGAQRVASSLGAPGR